MDKPRKTPRVIYEVRTKKGQFVGYQHAQGINMVSRYDLVLLSWLMIEIP